MAQFELAVEDNAGWCPVCGEFTSECVEPDAEGYECDICGENAVMGATYAAVSGEFIISALTSAPTPKKHIKTQADVVYEALQGADPSSALMAVADWLKELPDGCRQGTAKDLAGIAAVSMADDEELA
jgi:hypothetical protein